MGCIIVGAAMGGRLASLDALGLIWQASWLVQLVILLLVVLSVVSWAKTTSVVSLRATAPVGSQETSLSVVSWVPTSIAAV